MNLRLLLLSATVLLSACSATNAVTSNHIIPVAQGDQGRFVAVPPVCEGGANSFEPNPFTNQPIPGFGCANARNLALQIVKPADLIHPAPLGDADAIKAAGAIDRYRRGEIWGLYDPTKLPDPISTAPAAADSK